MLILKGHAAKPVRQVAFTPDGRRLISICVDHTLRVWDLETGSNERLPRERTSHYILWFALAPDGKTLVWGRQSDIQRYDLETGTMGVIGMGRDTRDFATSGAYSPDGRFLAAGYGPVWIWNTSTWKPVPWSPLFRRSSSWEIPTPSTHCFAFSPDSQTLATGNEIDLGRRRKEYVVNLWNLSTGQNAGILRGSTAQPGDLVYSPDGRYLACAGGHSILVWTVADSTVVAHLLVGSRYVKGLAFTPDGRFLLTASNDNTIRVLRTSDWKEHTALDWKLGGLVSLDIARDGMRAAAGSERGKIVVWDLEL